MSLFPSVLVGLPLVGIELVSIVQLRERHSHPLMLLIIENRDKEIDMREKVPQAECMA